MNDLFREHRAVKGAIWGGALSELPSAAIVSLASGVPVLTLLARVNAFLLIVLVLVLVARRVRRGRRAGAAIAPFDPRFRARRRGCR